MQALQMPESIPRRIFSVPEDDHNIPGHGIGPHNSTLDSRPLLQN